MSFAFDEVTTISHGSGLAHAFEGYILPLTGAKGTFECPEELLGCPIKTLTLYGNGLEVLFDLQTTATIDTIGQQWRDWPLQTTWAHSYLNDTL